MVENEQLSSWMVEDVRTGELIACDLFLMWESFVLKICH